MTAMWKHVFGILKWFSGMEATLWIQERQWWNKRVVDRGSTECRYLVLKLHDCLLSNSIHLVNLDLTARLTKLLFILQFKRVVWLPTDRLRIWGFTCTRQSHIQKIQHNYKKKHQHFKHTLNVCMCSLLDLMGHAWASLRTEYQENSLAVRKILPSWLDHVQESFPYI